MLNFARVFVVDFSEHPKNTFGSEKCVDRNFNRQGDFEKLKSPRNSFFATWIWPFGNSPGIGTNKSPDGKW